MMPWLTIATLALLGLLQPEPASARGCGDGATATALLVDELDVDGDLSDWPPDLEVYRVGGRSPASFRVVYSDETDLVYVGLEVEDDINVAGGAWHSTDGVEVFTWGGDPSDGKCEPRGGSSNPIQFAVVPGAGEYVPGCGNPCAKMGSGGHADPREQGALAAWRRKDEVTVYEWAVPVFEDYRKGPIELHPRAIGFDIIITENDRGGYHWKPWGNPNGRKFDSPTHVATLVLSEKRADSPLSAWLGHAAHVVGRLGLYGIGLAALICGVLIVRSAVNGRGGTQARLASLEQRITDTQDVLLALSEKYDRLEERLGDATRPGSGNKG
jgi:hypothetical protein